jgi:hypothetical protein
METTMRTNSNSTLAPTPLWSLQQLDHEMRCEISTSDHGPEMRLFYDGRALVCYRGASPESLLDLALSERDDLESRGWR